MVCTGEYDGFIGMGIEVYFQSGWNRVAHYWCSADLGKAYRSKRTDSGGNWISGNKKDCQAIKASQSFHVPDQNRTDAPASGGRRSIH